MNDHKVEAIAAADAGNWNLACGCGFDVTTSASESLLEIRTGGQCMLNVPMQSVSRKDIKELRKVLKCLAADMKSADMA